MLLYSILIIYLSLQYITTQMQSESEIHRDANIPSIADQVIESAVLIRRTTIPNRSERFDSNLRQGTAKNKNIESLPKDVRNFAEKNREPQIERKSVDITFIPPKETTLQVEKQKAENQSVPINLPITRLNTVQGNAGTNIRGISSGDRGSDNQNTNLNSPNQKATLLEFPSNKVISKKLSIKSQPKLVSGPGGSSAIRNGIRNGNMIKGVRPAGRKFGRVSSMTLQGITRGSKANNLQKFPSRSAITLNRNIVVNPPRNILPARIPKRINGRIVSNRGGRSRQKVKLNNNQRNSRRRNLVRNDGPKLTKRQRQKGKIRVLQSNSKSRRRGFSSKSLLRNRTNKSRFNSASRTSSRINEANNAKNTDRNRFIALKKPQRVINKRLNTRQLVKNNTNQAVVSRNQAKPLVRNKSRNIRKNNMVQRGLRRMLSTKDQNIKRIDQKISQRTLQTNAVSKNSFIIGKNQAVPIPRQNVLLNQNRFGPPRQRNIVQTERRKTVQNVGLIKQKISEREPQNIPSSIGSLINAQNEVPVRNNRKNLVRTATRFSNKNASIRNGQRIPIIPARKVGPIEISRSTLQKKRINGSNASLESQVRNGPLRSNANEISLPLSRIPKVFSPSRTILRNNNSTRVLPNRQFQTTLVSNPERNAIIAAKTRDLKSRQENKPVISPQPSKTVELTDAKTAPKSVEQVPFRDNKQNVPQQNIILDGTAVMKDDPLPSNEKMDHEHVVFLLLQSDLPDNFADNESRL